MQIASPNQDSTDDPDVPTTDDPDRYDLPDPPIGPEPDPKLDDHCNEDRCWSTEGLRLYRADEGEGEPVTLCRQCWKLWAGVSS